MSGPESARVPVTVTVDRLGIHFELRGSSAAWWPFGVIHAAPDAENPRHTRVERRSTGEALLVADAGFMAALESRSPHAHETGARATGVGRKVAVVVAGSLGLVAALYLVALPMMAGIAADRVSVEFERELGDAVLAQLLVGQPVCDDPMLTRSIDGIVARLRSVMPDHRYDFRVTVVDDTLVNALAVPGGAMVIFRGLLRNTVSPEELAGVLAHEIQHVQLRHGTRAVMRQLPLQAVAGMTGGASDAVAVLGVLGALSYARADEEEADVEGMRLVMAAHIDPRGMISFFDTLVRVTGSDAPALTYLSTHPATSTRRSTLAAMADAAPATQVAAVPLSAGEVAWSDLVQRCR